MTQAQVIAKINAEIALNGTGAITGTVANDVLVTIFNNIGNYELGALTGVNATVVAGDTLQVAIDKLNTMVSDRTLLADNKYIPIADSSADEGNTGATDTDLIIDAVPAALIKDNDRLLGRYSGTIRGAGSDTRQLRLELGGIEVFDSTALGITTNADWNLETVLVIVQGGNCRITTKLTIDNGSAPVTTCNYREEGGIDFDSGPNLVLKGQSAGAGASNNDIVKTMHSLVCLKAA